MIAANWTIAVFWDIRPYQCGGSIPTSRRILLEAVRVIRNVGKYLPDYTVSH
jgi:hypothetical protein